MKEMTSHKEDSPLDSIIERVRSYKQDPKMVTPETLAELEEELMDLKSYMDGDVDGDDEDKGMSKDMESEGMEHKGLTVILGKVGK